MNYKYECRFGAPFKKKHTQQIGEFISSIKDRTTENILTEIRKHPKHIIFSYINWKDKMAAQQHRLQQVRNIVNHLEITIKRVGNSEPIRTSVFVSIKNENEPNTYEHLPEAMKQPDQRAQIINRAKTEMDNWISRYQQYIEFSKFIIDLKQLIKKIH